MTTFEETKSDIRYLKLLAEKFPTITSAASEIINNVLSTLEMNDISAQDALDDIQSQLEDAGLL